MSLLLKFNSYTFPAGFGVIDGESPRELQTTQLPRCDGAAIGLPSFKARTFKLSGAIVAAGVGAAAGGDVRASVRAMKGALSAQDGTLQIESDSFFRLVNLSDFRETYGSTASSTYSRIAVVEIDLEARDPYEYESAGAYSNWTTMGSPTTVYNGVGTAPALPTLVIDLVNDTNLNRTFTNTTTGDSFTLAGVPSGVTLELNSQAQTLLCDTDGQNNMFLFDGIWPHLTPGDNVFTMTVNSGDTNTITSINFAWDYRYY